MASWLYEEVNLPPRSGTKPLEARAEASAAELMPGGAARDPDEAALIRAIAKALGPVLRAANAAMGDDSGRTPELDVKVSGEVMHREHVRVWISIAGGLK